MTPKLFTSITIIGLASLPVLADPAPKSSSRRVAAATGGHGNQTAVAASVIAEKIPAEKSATLSLFATDGDPKKPLVGKNRHIAGATSGHGSVSIPSMPAPVVKTEPTVIETPKSKTAKAK